MWRIAEASAPVDEAQSARVTALEAELVELNGQLHKRRKTVPAQIAQRLEAQSRTAVSALVSAADAAATAAATEVSQAGESAAAETRLALTSTLQECTAVSAACTEQAGGEVARAIEQASEMTAQIGATVAAIPCPTATDLAIVAGSDDAQKENQAAAAALLRKRRGAQQQTATTLAPKLTM